MSWKGAYEPRSGAVQRTSIGGTTIYINKGIKRSRKANKRLAAFVRNKETQPERRRSFARQFGYSRNSERIANGLEI